MSEGWGRAEFQTEFYVILGTRSKLEESLLAWMAAGPTSG